MLKTPVEWLLTAVTQIGLYTCTQFSSVAQSCPTLWNPLDCSMPGFLVHHQLPELPQTHVHRVGDAIQTSHPLSSPSHSAFNLSQHQVAKVLELQHQSFQWIFRTDFLWGWLVESPCNPSDSQQSSSTPQFTGSQLSLSYYAPKDVILCPKFATLSTKSPFKSSKFRSNIPTMRIIVLDQIIFSVI